MILMISTKFHQIGHEREFKQQVWMFLFEGLTLIEDDMIYIYIYI